MNVSLTPELESMVQEKVRSGMYHSASEVIRAALRLMDERDELMYGKLRELRQDVGHAVEQADRGESSELSIDDLKQEARRQKTRR